MVFPVLCNIRTSLNPLRQCFRNGANGRLDIEESAGCSLACIGVRGRLWLPRNLTACCEVLTGRRRINSCLIASNARLRLVRASFRGGEECQQEKTLRKPRFATQL